MAIYIHIPFCRQACHYCDFHFSTSLHSRSQMVKAMLKEIEMQRFFFEKEPNKSIQSIYLGGGTPSLLESSEIEAILNQIYRHFSIAPDAEITIETNPDDLNPHILQTYQKLGINRLSVGIQSFHVPHLQWLNRIHDAEKAKNVIREAQDIGFENITIDLIYGIPAESHSIWENDIQTALGLNVAHISSYCLTIEPKTNFGMRVKKGSMTMPDDEFAAQQFLTLIQRLTEAGFEHYEISNFAKNGNYSRHNSNYWKKGTYLGIAPSAHSYSGTHRHYTIANNKAYIQSIETGKIPYQIELLSREDHINEYLLTSLRTHWGCDIQMLKKEYNFDLLSEYKNAIVDFQEKKWLILENQTLKLTSQGKLWADEIALAFFIEK